MKVGVCEATELCPETGKLGTRHFKRRWAYAAKAYRLVVPLYPSNKNIDSYKKS